MSDADPDFVMAWWRDSYLRTARDTPVAVLSDTAEGAAERKTQMRASKHGLDEQRKRACGRYNKSSLGTDKANAKQRQMGLHYKHQRISSSCIEDKQADIRNSTGMKMCLEEILLSKVA